MHEISLSHCKRRSMSGTHKNKIESEQFPGESTYLADKEIRLLMELEGRAKGVLDLSAYVILCLPGLLLLLLVAKKS